MGNYLFNIKRLRIIILLISLVALNIKAQMIFNNKIFRGIPTLGGQWPSVVALTNHAYPAFGPFCSGVIITPNIIFTAAHCVEAIDKEHLRVFVGNSYRRENTSDLYRVKEIHIHPFYNILLKDYDFAYLVLNDKIQDIPIVPPIKNEKEFKQATIPLKATSVIGFGLIMGHISKKSHSIMSIKYCTHSEIILAGIGLQLISAGDSGGPLFTTLPNGQLRLLGIASRSNDPYALYGGSVFGQIYMAMDWYYLNEGKKAYQNKDYSGAKIFFDKLIKLRPQNRDGYYYSSLPLPNDLFSKSANTYLRKAAILLIRNESKNTSKIIKLICTALNNKANINSPIDFWGNSILHKAIEMQNVRVVKFLLSEESIDINLKSFGLFENTPLMVAVQTGSLEIIKLLLQDDLVNIFEKNKYNRSALDLAQIYRKQEIIDLLSNLIKNY